MDRLVVFSGQTSALALYTLTAAAHFFTRSISSSSKVKQSISIGAKMSIRLLLACGLLICADFVQAQVGGKTSADGPFLIDDAEDLNLHAESLGRDWISGFVWPAGNILSVTSPSGLTLASGQSPAGILEAQIAADNFGSIDAGFGIPVPGVVGASTLDSPGNITSFTSLEFLACHRARNITADIDFQVLMECYPGNGDGTYPTLVWKYTPASGTTFGLTQIDLRTPALILNNPSGLSVEQLLGSTRFLYFYFFSNPVSMMAELTVNFDDITLEGNGGGDTGPEPSGMLAGKTAADGPFLLEPAEDQNFSVESLGRDWLPDFVKGQSVLTMPALSGSGLTLASGQSPIGAVAATVPDDGFGSLNGGFGVPLPGQVGASTADSPGDITSFSYFNFLACYGPAGLANQKFQIMVECYPANGDGTFPTVFWNYEPAAGQSFEWVSIKLDMPAGTIRNPAALTASELLTRTRFLYFYFFASPVEAGTTLTTWLDDLQLTTSAPELPTNAASGWTIYN
jgi:hypothetical protein